MLLSGRLSREAARKPAAARGRVLPETYSGRRGIPPPLKVKVTEKPKRRRNYVTNVRDTPTDQQPGNSPVVILPSRARDALLAAAVAAASLALYVATLQPDFGGPEDTPKFQFIGYVLGIPHRPVIRSTCCSRMRSSRSR